MPLDYPSPPRKDELVELRPWEADDLELIEDARVDPYVRLIEHLPEPWTPDAAEVGHWAAPRPCGRGPARRATSLLCAWGIRDGAIARIFATVEPWNEPSRRVLERVGFLREGLLRSYASYSGSRQDVYMYSLLPSDVGEPPPTGPRKLSRRSSPGTSCRSRRSPRRWGS